MSHPSVFRALVDAMSTRRLVGIVASCEQMVHHHQPDDDEVAVYNHVCSVLCRRLDLDPKTVACSAIRPSDYFALMVDVDEALNS